MIKLGLIEDDVSLLKNYKEYFSNESIFNIVFAVPDIKQLFKNGFEVSPDIILLDLMLPSGNSLDFIHKIKQYFPKASIIILSAISDQAISQSALQKGAHGFLLKSSSLHFIKDALLKVSEGGMPLSPSIVNHLIHLKKNEQTLIEAYPNLTKKEIEIIYLLKTGMSNKMAAAVLDVTFFTINQHSKSIYKKLNIHSKSELIAISHVY
ncbi:DNA-binding NarL/FixJ family response regulator [Pedobacter sp. CG_S7]|uniref:response regulator transcription factor n=1 Tax=Pedobacter sp. CG_S7 TaxID=3143930 RepID=UPI00339AAC10